MTGEWLLILLVVGLIALGIIYVAHPEWFSEGWLGESRIALPSPARNRSIGVTLIAVGVIAAISWLWSYMMMR